MLAEEDLKAIQLELEAYEADREKVLVSVRKAIRLASKAIMQMHGGDLAKAWRTIQEAELALEEAGGIATSNPNLRAIGELLTAKQELVEAKVLFHIIKDNVVPTMEQVGSSPIPYILGLLDVVGEVRRVVLDKLRIADAKSAESLLNLMEGIYIELLSLEHTDPIKAFRRKLDLARKIIEATRGDVIAEVRKIALEEAIRSLRGLRE